MVDAAISDAPPHLLYPFSSTTEDFRQAVDDLGSNLFQSFQTVFLTMTTNITCPANCSGRGECQEGVCLCEVQYEGEICREPNVAYFVAFSSVFFFIAAVCLTQLVICIRAEYSRMKMPSLRVACRITTQKLLYFITFIAAALRGAYFASPSHAELNLATTFVSAFYPIILSAGSLIVCFWAEAFHLPNIRCDKPRFLSKSIFGFLMFNFITYSLYATEIVLTKGAEEDDRDFFAHIFTGCYAVLMFIVVVFFLVYGVEVYFKVRGGFVGETMIVRNVRSHHTAVPSQFEPPLLEPSLPPDAKGRSSVVCSKEGDITCHTDERENGTKLLRLQLHSVHLKNTSPAIDSSQLHQSRFGLVFQACMLLFTVCFLFSDVLGKFWKYKVPLMSRNAYNIVFRVVDLAVTLWFPCVLWNCIAPEQLWILNPKKILKKLDIDQTLNLGDRASADDNNCGTGAECWICYDPDRRDAGPLIHPCECKGDVGDVHHNCLKKWLMECAESNSIENLSCKVCGYEYKLERSRAWWIGRGFTAKHWFHTVALVTLICGTVASAWAIVSVYKNSLVQAATAGFCLLLLYLYLRFLGFNTVSAYRRGRYSAVEIISRRFGTSSNSSTVPSSSTSHSFTGQVHPLATISSDLYVTCDKSTAKGVNKMTVTEI